MENDEYVAYGQQSIIPGNTPSLLSFYSEDNVVFLVLVIMLMLL